MLNKLPVEVLFIIYDFLNDTPQNNYSKVITELKNFISFPYCSIKCCILQPSHYYGKFLRQHYTYTLYENLCNICFNNSIALGSHTVCYRCANKYDFPKEFDYHHSSCKYLSKVFL